MKKQMIVLATIFFVAIFSLSVKAQVSENTHAGAKIVTALSLTELAPLHFGTMTIPTGSLLVTVDPDGLRTASVPANIVLLNQVPTPQAAGYRVNGTPDSFYVITLPDAFDIMNVFNDDIGVSSFQAKTSSSGLGVLGTLSGSGMDTFSLGATITLESGQDAGVYDGTFDVSVDYN